MSIQGLHSQAAQEIVRRYADINGVGEVPQSLPAAEDTVQYPQPHTPVLSNVSNETPKPKRRSPPETVMPQRDPFVPIATKPVDKQLRARYQQKLATTQPDVQPEPWDDPRASCYSIDDSLFEDKSWESAARALCKACVLRVPCLERELDMPTTDGIRGGLNFLQRIKLVQIRQNGLTQAQGRKYDARSKTTE